MAYTKLDSGITDSTVWAAPDATRITWITMLAMADQHGYVGASIPGLAARARVTLEGCLAALECFKAPDKYSRTKDHEGRRIVEADGGWVLLNHAKYRALQSADDRRERSRLAMASLRAKRREEKATKANGYQSLTKLAQAEAEAEAINITPISLAGDVPPTPKIKPKAAAKQSAIERPATVTEQTWTDWHTLRKAKAAPVTSTVLKTAFREAEKAGITLESFLQIWCMRGSVGLMAEWLKPEELGRARRTVPHQDPPWRAEQRARNRAFAGPAAAPLSQSADIIDITGENDGPSRIVG